VLALVGARDPRGSQFNHALDAKRPVGSLLKPFVYLLALSDPERFSLGSLLSDEPLVVALGQGRTWKPQNYDRKNHGNVALIDALAKSYNVAAARIGVQLGVDRLALLLTSLGVASKTPAQPSLILGGSEFSPLEVTQLYQALANGGRVAPLSSVRAVLDRDGRALRRFPPQSMQQPDADAIKLVSFALNETTRSGTASTLSRQVKIDVAGKTGTSNDQRDSWYAGYTGSHLGVVWIGHGNNQATEFTGASGALKVWSTLFKSLPSKPLRFELPSYTRWVPFDMGRGCDSMRFLPVLSADEPANARSCMSALTAP
jgi:penicillin-binding protein 1B